MLAEPRNKHTNTHKSLWIYSRRARTWATNKDTSPCLLWKNTVWLALKLIFNSRVAIKLAEETKNETTAPAQRFISLSDRGGCPRHNNAQMIRERGQKCKHNQTTIWDAITQTNACSTTLSSTHTIPHPKTWWKLKHHELSLPLPYHRPPLQIKAIILNTQVENINLLWPVCT